MKKWLIVCILAFAFAVSQSHSQQTRGFGGGSGAAVSGTVTVGSTIVGKAAPDLLGISWPKGMIMKSYCPICGASSSDSARRIIAMLNGAGIHHLRILTLEVETVATYVSGSAPHNMAANQFGDADLMNFANFVCAMPRLTFTWGINYLNNTPAVAAQEAASVNRLLGPGGSACKNRLSGFEIGNEPDNASYGTGQAAANKFALGWNTYAKAIRAAVPGATFVGPSLGLTNSMSVYLPPFMSMNAALLSRVTQHYYDGSSKYPNIAQILEQGIDPRVKTQGATLEAISAAHGNLPIEINETNTAPNGGVAGVSNTRASAIWAVTNAFDFSIAAAGAGPVTLDYMSGGAPVYGGTYTKGYSPIVDTPGSTWSNPELTGMRLVSLIGPGDMKSCAVAISLNVRCYQVGTKTVLVNQSEQSVQLSISLPGGTSSASSILASPPFPGPVESDLKVQGLAEGPLSETVAGGKIVTTVPPMSIRVITEGR